MVSKKWLGLILSKYGGIGALVLEIAYVIVTTVYQV